MTFSSSARTLLRYPERSGSPPVSGPPPAACSAKKSPCMSLERRMVNFLVTPMLVPLGQPCACFDVTHACPAGTPLVTTVEGEPGGRLLRALRQHRARCACVHDRLVCRSARS